MIPDQDTSNAGGAVRNPGTVLEVCATFLKLGLTSFGGPIAHLGYFHREIVVRRRWIDETHYAQLIALCQFLPGPASSQLGFSLGLLRAGWAGAIAAFLAFTLPSVLLLFAFSSLMPLLKDPYGLAALQGLKLLAVAVVGQGVVIMAQRLTTDLQRRLIALVVATVCIVNGTAIVQFIVIVAGAIAGALLCRTGAVHETVNFNVAYGVRTGIALLALFAAVLAGALLLPTNALPLMSVAAAFYRAGALVFGGGHVVLPLLQESIVSEGWVDPQEFLAGYGAAQAVPGPMFSFAAFLGARIYGMLGATVSVLAIFLPGLLLVAGALPLWRRIASDERSARAIAGINAAVVGLLAAALYDPVWQSAVHDGWDIAIAMIGFALLIATRLPVLIVAAGFVLAALVRQGLTA